MLSGSYYGQTVQIWAALMMAAILAASLVGLIGLAERLTARAMGARRDALEPANWKRLEAVQRLLDARLVAVAGAVDPGPLLDEELAALAVGLEVDRGGDAVADEHRQGEVPEYAFRLRHIGLEAMVVAEEEPRAACAG